MLRRPQTLRGMSKLESGGRERSRSREYHHRGSEASATAGGSSSATASSAVVGGVNTTQFVQQELMKAANTTAHQQTPTGAALDRQAAFAAAAGMPTSPLQYAYGVGVSAGISPISGMPLALSNGSDPPVGAGNVCVYFLNGICQRGSGCFNVHPATPEDCRSWRSFFQAQPCKYGTSCKTRGCLYGHHVQPTMTGITGIIGGSTPGATSSSAGEAAANKPDPEKEKKEKERAAKAR